MVKSSLSAHQNSITDFDIAGAINAASIDLGLVPLGGNRSVETSFGRITVTRDKDGACAVRVRPAAGVLLPNGRDVLLQWGGPREKGRMILRGMGAEEHLVRWGMNVPETTRQLLSATVRGEYVLPKEPVKYVAEAVRDEADVSPLVDQVKRHFGMAEDVPAASGETFGEGAEAAAIAAVEEIISVTLPEDGDDAEVDEFCDQPNFVKLPRNRGKRRVAEAAI